MFDATKAPQPLPLPGQVTAHAAPQPAIQLPRRARMSTALIAKAQLIIPTSENCTDIESIADEIAVIRKQDEVA